MNATPRALLLAAIALAGLPATARCAGPDNSPTTDENGFLVHRLNSPLEDGETSLRVLLPQAMADGERLKVVYVLPVEAGNQRRYGDGLLEVKRLGLHDKHHVIFAAPSFSQLPWYADHPTNPALRQESYFTDVVVPLVENRHPALAEPSGRLLLGFSKSGWGAWTLLVRHPERFGRAAAWDAPLAMDAPGRYGSGPIFGTPENFEHYHLAARLPQRAGQLGGRPRLILTGYDNFRADHVAIHELLERLEIPHIYRDGPRRQHDWHSGWVAEAVELLVQ